MADESKTLDQIMSDLRRMREELAVQISLGKAEAKDEWAKLEKKWAEVQAQAKPFTDVAGETAGNVGSALGMAADELKSGYERIRKLL